METVTPDWLEKLRSSYLSGGASMYILHGNVSDIFPTREGDTVTAEPLTDFLVRRLFPGYDLVLHYDVGRGLRAFAGNDPRRLTQMNALLARHLGENTELPRDPTQSLRLIDRLLSLLLTGGENHKTKVAVLIDYADLICPGDDRGGEHLATLLNWARSPVIRRINVAFVLMTEALARLHSALVQSGYTQEISIPMPTEEMRADFVRGRVTAEEKETATLAKMSAGLTLTSLDRMLRLLTQNAGGGLSAESFARLSAIKKDLMEAQAPGLLEFVEPKHTLDLVAGHTAAKERLVNDARLLREGNLDAVPMGYLICGPVGVGKTFLALCYAGSVGIPCVTIRNFRSKYVGETEANLERVLSVIRELGPIAVIIDEADAAVGDRGASGDSGTSARAFAQLASQMGDTRYRGRIVWFMLTCRPDLLPVDLKRQGRCEEHIPLFYPQTAHERRDMFLAMAKKAKVTLDESAVPSFEQTASLSGADIESILTRARREALLRGQAVDAPLLSEVLQNFRSARGAAHELQWLAAILESSDLRYLPADVRTAYEKPGGAEVLTRRFAELSALDAAGGL